MSTELQRIVQPVEIDARKKIEQINNMPVANRVDCANKMRFRSCMCKILTYNVNIASQESPDVKSRGLFIENLIAQTIYLCVPVMFRLRSKSES